MNKGTGKKHYIDIMFLMILFLIFTFSAVSVLILAINSYKSVVNSSESNSSARIASAYIREVIHQNDADGEISLDKLNGVDCLKISQGDDTAIYIYEYGGYLRELNAKEDSGATVDFGDKIMQLTAISFNEIEDSVLEIILTDTYGNEEVVDVAIMSEATEENYYEYSGESVEEESDEN